MKSIIFQFIAPIAVSLPLWADAPLAAPEKHSSFSANGKYEAIVDPQAGTRCVDKSTQETIWRIPKWYRHLFLSNNGKYAVAVYDGYMLPIGYNKKMTLLTFLKEGKVVRETPVEEIITDPKILIRTVSNYEWGEVEGFTEDGFLRVRLNNQVISFFDPETGRLTEKK